MDSPQSHSGLNERLLDISNCLMTPFWVFLFLFFSQLFQTPSRLNENVLFFLEAAADRNSLKDRRATETWLFSSVRGGNELSFSIGSGCSSRRSMFILAVFTFRGFTVCQVFLEVCVKDVGSMDPGGGREGGEGGALQTPLCVATEKAT